MNLITDCPQEVQSLAAANLANMAKSSLGRNILKRHGGLQKLVRLHLKFKVSERGKGFDIRLAILWVAPFHWHVSCHALGQERFFAVHFATKVYKWVSPNVCQNPTTFVVKSDWLICYPGKYIIIISSEFYSNTIWVPHLHFSKKSFVRGCYALNWF